MLADCFKHLIEDSDGPLPDPVFGAPLFSFLSLRNFSRVAGKREFFASRNGFELLFPQAKGTCSSPPPPQQRNPSFRGGEETS